MHNDKQPSAEDNCNDEPQGWGLARFGASSEWIPPLELDEDEDEDEPAPAPEPEPASERWFRRWFRR